jgi:hypothetical protein
MRKLNRRVGQIHPAVGTSRWPLQEIWTVQLSRPRPVLPNQSWSSSPSLVLRNRRTNQSRTPNPLLRRKDRRPNPPQQRLPRINSFVIQCAPS